MIPLVTGVDELRQVKAMINEIKSELDEKTVAYGKNIKLGVMIETPSAAVNADLLAKEADFFSIGTAIIPPPEPKRPFARPVIIPRI